VAALCPDRLTGHGTSWMDCGRRTQRVPSFGREDDRTLGESGVLTPHREPHDQVNRGAVIRLVGRQSRL